MALMVFTVPTHTRITLPPHQAHSHSVDPSSLGDPEDFMDVVEDDVVVVVDLDTVKADHTSVLVIVAQVDPKMQMQTELSI